MDSSDFLELLRALTHLSSTQLERAQQHIRHHLQADLLRQSFSEHHADEPISCPHYRDWETDRKSTRLNSSHITRSRMPSSA